MNTFCRWDQIPFKIFWLFWKNLQKLQKKLPAKNVFRFDFKIDGGKSGKIDWKNEIIVIVYDRRSFMSDWRSYFWEFKMNDRGSYFYNIRAHDREWSWLMKKMIVPITGTIKRIKVGIGITWNKQHPNDHSKLSEREIPHNTTWHWK